ncbi:MAG: hypothetical protein NC548_10865 [Lachnospiraceae bacterium]|nr:hypothetical protein [Lachnospiraceae bacterium]
MRKFKRVLANILLLCIVGGALSPTLNVYAAPASTIVDWADTSKPDSPGSFEISGVTYPFWNSSFSSFSISDHSNAPTSLGLPAFNGTASEYVADVETNTGMSSIGGQVGTTNDYVARVSTAIYAHLAGNNYSATSHGDVPTESTRRFSVQGTEYEISGDWTQFMSNISSEAYSAIGNDLRTNLGILGMNAVNPTPKSGDNAEDVGLGSVTAPALNTLAEFFVYATKYREYAYGGNAEFAPYKTEQECKDILDMLDKIQMAYDSMIPAFGTLANWAPAGEMSLHEMAEASDGNYTPAAPVVSLDSTFEQVLDESTPLGLFYIINTENGVARIDRESVWNNRDIDRGSADEVQEWLDDMNGVEDGVNKWSIAGQYSGEFIQGSTAALSAYTSSEAGIDNEGTAINTNAVSMSDYITQGMIYSSTFVPMKTNLYSPDTLAQFDQEFRENFYYKYGFMRKALMWDKSGTAAVDFYNANGKCTGTLSVVTLRDLLESNGNDIALYVDSDFYNAAEAIEEGNTLLDLKAVNNAGLANYLSEYINCRHALEVLMKEDGITLSSVLSALGNTLSSIKSAISNLFGGDSATTNSASSTQLDNDAKRQALEASVNAATAELKNKYNFDMTTSDLNMAEEYYQELQNANNFSSQSILDEHVLKTGDFSQYSNKTEALLKQCQEFGYRKIEEEEPVNNDNRDTLVLPSSTITSYMDAMSSYENRIVREDDGIIVVNRYTSYDDYTPMLSLSYVSAIYREGNYYSLANLVANDNPVFLASDDLCGIEDAGQWYCNTLLNYALVQNLKSATQVDYTYTIDLDCPLYIDVFGNILTESGIVVIPAAANATLHPADFKDSNVAVGLYSVYGRDYYVPYDTVGAAKAMFPFFALDKEEGVYIINGAAVTIGTDSVTYNALSPYDVSTQNAVQAAYESYIKNNGRTNLNWISLVNIANEVMRGAPIENIDKAAEGLDVVVERNKAAIVAAVKLESLIDSFEGMMQNTLISIPDFTRMDSMEYLVAFLIKILIVATTAVIIVGVYRDGVSSTLGLRTLWKSLTSVALTFSAVCVIPAVFQLTYYAANKFILQDEAMRILMLNTEKYQSGVEIGMLETYTPEDTSDMAIQLDWISVPWYDQLENMLYGSTLKNLDEVKKKAYLQSPIYDNHDVEVHDDGVYVTVKDLFEGVNIDYTFNDISQTVSTTEDQSNASVNGMYLYSTNELQTASFYSPYYAFLTVLVGNVNEYNYYHSSYNYTTKYMSGNRLKTVGLCNDYFTSKSFMELDEDIMHIYEIYDDPRVNTYDHGYLFTDADKELFYQSYWHNDIDGEHLYKRIELLNKYARDFVADNKDMLMKVSDETFIKVMALNMAIKYNQLWGIPAANALEIYNMDSNDLLRLSIVKSDEAVLSSPMSYSRYVYNFGGEPAVYAAAVLTVIMWVGSFIKPLCTVITFISVFLSIWVFRVVLRKPSANLLGYLITVTLLCCTNLLHAVILKISIYLPNIGLSPLGCLLFIIFGQVAYLLLLGYVTGVSLKDWSNLGFAEYDREAQRIKRKLGSKRMAQDTLSGRIPRHDNNWDYYNDLVDQHRARNA